MGRTRRANTKLISMAPGMIANAVSASRQFRETSNPTAITSRNVEMAG